MLVVDGVVEVGRGSGANRDDAPHPTLTFVPEPTPDRHAQNLADLRLRPSPFARERVAKIQPHKTIDETAWLLESASTYETLRSQEAFESKVELDDLCPMPVVHRRTPASRARPTFNHFAGARFGAWGAARACSGGRALRRDVLVGIRADGAPIEHMKNAKLAQGRG